MGKGPEGESAWVHGGSLETSVDGAGEPGAAVGSEVTRTAPRFLPGPRPLTAAPQRPLCGDSGAVARALASGTAVLGPGSVLWVLAPIREQTRPSERWLGLQHHPDGHQIKGDTHSLSLALKVGGT